MANTFKNYTQKAIGTTPTAVYTVASATQATVIGMTVTNVTAAPVGVSVGVGTAPTTWLIKDATIAPGGALVPVGGDQKLVLEATDILVANASSSGGADVIVSVLEIT